MKTRAKMRVASVLVTGYSDLVTLQAVYGGGNNAEDNTYAKATPSGKLELQIDNPAVRGAFKPDQVYYVDLTQLPADPAAGPAVAP
jgi:hypothetical protein